MSVVAPASRLTATRRGSSRTSRTSAVGSPEVSNRSSVDSARRRRASSASIRSRTSPSTAATSTPANTLPIAGNGTSSDRSSPMDSASRVWSAR